MSSALFRRLLTLGAALAIVPGACGSSPSSPGPSAPASGAVSASASAGAPAGQASLGPRTGLEHAVYYLVEDSSGMVPTEGSRVVMIFEAHGSVLVSAESATDQLAHHGTYTRQGGTVTLEFEAEDFAVDATFDLDPGAATVSMPFQVFSDEAGSSTWTRGQMSLVSELLTFAGAALSDPANEGMAAAELVDQVYQLALDRVAAGGDLETDRAAVSPLDILAARFAPGPGLSDVLPPQADSDVPRIKNVEKTANGVRIYYDDGPTIDVPLFNWAADPLDPTPITPGPLMYDPRVHINVESAVSGKDDPANKTALFISPFETGRYYGHFLAQWAPPDWDLETGYQQPSKGFDWDENADILEDHGYEVTQLMDEDATLLAIIEDLGATTRRAPGLVMINSHGSPHGWMATGVDLGHDGPDARARLQTLERELAKAGYGDLLTFDGGTLTNPKTLGLVSLHREDAEGVFDYFVAITPSFWAWLTEAAHVDFSHSLVYAASCWSDDQPDNRIAIKARAFLGITALANPKLVGAMGNYLVAHLARKTHSAEEAYYNLFRIVATRQAIYKEDVGLKEAIPEALTKQHKWLEYFRGWGWDGKQLLAYDINGWLDRAMNPGSVWYLLYAGRWSKDAFDGGLMLVRCWKDYWVNGDPGGMKDQICNSAHPGDVTQDEVAYATYLLTGNLMLPYSGTPVPRWTLDDG
jgi:hypothetical protein